MQPVIIDMRSRKFVGLGTKFVSVLAPGAAPSNAIPQLWHDWQQRHTEIRHRVGDAAYGLVDMLPPEQRSNPHELFYMAASEVSDLADQPNGLISRVVPAGKYARFTHVGKLDTLGKTYAAIFKEWMPTSGMRRRPAADIEVYDHRFKMGQDDSQLDILVPVE